jgi:hypothetical protein
VIIEVRAADSKIERVAGLASELVGINLDVIVVSNSVAGGAVQQATTTIPIVERRLLLFADNRASALPSLHTESARR